MLSRPGNICVKQTKIPKMSGKLGAFSGGQKLIFLENDLDLRKDHESEQFGKVSPKYLRF